MKTTKILAALGFTAILAGCATTAVTSSMTPAQAAQALANQQTQQYQECVIYHASQPAVAQKVLTLTLPQAATLYDASVQATKYCSTVLSNTQANANLLASALTTVAMEAGINFSVPGPVNSGVK